MTTKIELQGRIIRVEETQTFNSGFQKREIVIECGDDKFENPIPIEATKNKCEHLDKYKPGEVVEISGYLNGNYWDKRDRYFLSLRLAYIKHAEGHGQADPGAYVPPPEEPSQSAELPMDAEEEEPPF